MQFGITWKTKTCKTVGTVSPKRKSTPDGVRFFLLLVYTLDIKFKYSQHLFCSHIHTQNHQELLLEHESNEVYPI